MADKKPLPKKSKTQTVAKSSHTVETGMKHVVGWLNDALAKKEIGIGMTYYRCKGGAISATDGRITASHPWAFGGEFLVPGKEFEKILDRLSDEKVKLTAAKDNRTLKLQAGRFSGMIETLPLTEWDHPGVADAKWKKLPPDLLPLLDALRPFVLDNASSQLWAECIALQKGWVFATNNIAIAGAPCKGLEAVSALLPAWAVDFVTARKEGLQDFACNDSYIAFRWKNGAWMRSQLIVGQFPEKAAGLVQQTHASKPTFKITDEFREAFSRIAELADDTVEIYADKLQSKFGKSLVVDGIACKAPKGAACSIWSAKHLLPAMNAATAWSPELWPAPAIFKGALLSGCVVGRRVVSS